MNWQEKFNELSHSPVFLEEENHVYIHKTTGVRYVSVTTALGLIKNKFDESIKSNMVRMYRNFNNWVKNQGVTFKGDIDLYLRMIGLYVNYRKKRKFVQRVSKSGSKYKAYKKLTDYTVKSFMDEFEKLEKNDPVDRFNHIYINPDGSIMNEDQIGEYWKMTSYIANLYGSMVHEIVEEYILLKQRFVRARNVEENIRKNFYTLKEELNKRLNIVNENAFKEYIIDQDIESFKNHIIKSFNSLNMDLGRICVPERLMFLEEYNLAGMTDVFIDQEYPYFSIGDHKTNKELSKFSKYGQKLLKPFSHYDDCSFNIYNLQLSLYAYMYEHETNFKKQLKELWISYYSRLDHKFHKHYLSYLKEDVIKVLGIYKKYLTSVVEKFKNRGLLEGISPKFHMHLSHTLQGYLERDTKTGMFKNMNKLSEAEKKHKKDEMFRLYKIRVEQYMSQQKDVFII